ncbi:TonB system transport protein ExbB [Campylobacter ureolyticus RIGS 9880]|uniref:TonB system transport protein ExbB n=1 Tax=Campylobacter ureolyticus RIGS 9880 TaxID=1032069 RepID=A0AAU8TY27_9BACT|nr:MotA/TolQ/ExbB proton channel family protein [Campylobacter ureolyticus]AKT90096.1 TonB system transport protein ExbB [Campylobacter ureolyticus RIGS 9880]
MKKIFFMFFIVVGLCFAENNLQSKNLNTSNLVENLQNLDENLPQNSKNYQHSNLNLNQNLDLNSKIQTKEKSKFTLFSLYENADMVVKFVIYILVIFSLLTWSVLIAKVIEFWRYKKILKLDLFYTRKAIFLEDLPTLKENSFMEIFKNEAIDEIEKSKNLDGIKARIKTRFETKINSFLTNARNFTSILASIGSSAPFIGLFGTVWGIMNSFIGIASSNDTGLDVVAPGIAEALFATAFGLGAAIPAVLFYNYITRKTAKFANELDEIATSVYVIADRTLDKK